MHTRLYSSIAMLGVAPETRGSIAAVVESYRANGLFKRWPIQYIATSGDGTLVQRTVLLAKAARDFTALLAQHRRMVVHVHAASGAGFWREAKKGIYDLLDAVAGLRAAVPDVRLVCAGDGDRIGVARYAERLGIADAVKFTGWVGPSGKRALLEHAAAFALPSYDEALPVSLLEAMSAGVPVVASPTGGIGEVVADGKSGC